MAAETHALTKGGGATYHSKQFSKGISVWTVTLDVATWVTTKGTALEANDIAQVLTLPAGSLVLGAVANVTTVFAGTTYSGTLDIGWGSGADAISDGSNPATLGLMAAGTNGSAGFTKFFTDSDTLDVKIATISNVLSTGVLRLDVVVADAGVSSVG